jgi:hypothetical protein
MAVAWAAIGVAPFDAQSRSAVLEGRVADTSGGVIEGAQVSVRDPTTNQSRSTSTDREGTFRLIDLPVATYEIRIDYTGFTPYVHTGLTLAIGQTARLSIALRPAAVVESVAVSAQPPPLDPGQTSVATTIDTERIEELPVRSRNYLQFVLLAPGVTRAPSVPSGPATASATFPGSGFSFGGLRPRSNTLTIDGLDNNDEFTGSSRTELSLEVVREFQVVSSGWSAESGAASGGVINVVTKSGANVIHGDTFLFAQSGIFNARPKLEAPAGQKPALRRFRGGMAIGGPVVKDRTFYYAAGEREQSDGQAASNIDPDAFWAINAALSAALWPELATRRLTAGLFSTKRAETEWSGRITQQLAGRGAFVGRVAGTDIRDEQDAFGNSALSDLSARGSRDTRDIAFTSSWTMSLGSRTSNDLRGQLASRRLDLHSTERRGAGVSIAGVADFGMPYTGNTTHDQTYSELGDTVGYSHGSHFLKAGIDVKHVRVTGRSDEGTGGIYLFRTLDAFVTGRADQFRRMSAAGNVDLATTRAAAFVQDRWTPGGRLTVDAGVRLDGAALPASVGVTSRQVTPRFGLAWTPAAKWIVRGGAGIFADRIVLAALERPWLAQQRQVTELIADGTSTAMPFIYTVRRGKWNSQSRQASVGAERQLTANLTVLFNYLRVQGRKLLRTVPVDGQFELQPTAASTYDGLTMSANRRLANEVEWSAAYTWSRARDSASDFDEQPQNSHALDGEWAASRWDQRHRLVLNALIDLPIGEDEDRRAGEVPGVWVRALSHIAVAPILTIGSGLPANVTTGADDRRNRAFPLTSRPAGVARNSWRLPGSATLDVRLLKFFNIKPHGKLDFVVEAFNVLNRTNVTQVNTVYGPLLTPLRSFGRPVGAGAARQLQFSIDFEF